MNLSESIHSKDVILFDGAMGTQLEVRGLEMGGPTNLSHPDAVMEVHKAYIAAGSQIIITNTMSMNRIYLQSHHLPVDLREVNLRGAEIARQAAAKNVFVVGDISTTGQLLEPYGDLKAGDAEDAIREQARILLEGGVDGFIVETMIDLNEALCALRACKSVADLPVFVTLSFSTADNGGFTSMGNSAADCAMALTDAGADVIGANCGGLSPLDLVEIVKTMKSNSTLPILVQPNAGKPKLVEGRTEYDMTPQEFESGMKACISAGAKLVGGCCGTSPEHILALGMSLKSG